MGLYVHNGLKNIDLPEIKGLKKDVLNPPNSDGFAVCFVVSPIIIAYRQPIAAN